MRYMRYTVKTKLEVIAYAKSTSISEASRKYTVPRSCIRQSIVKDEELSEMRKGACRLPGGGRKPACEALEELFSARVFQLRLEGLRVTRTMIINWGKEMGVETGEEIGFSKVWLERFLDRHGFVLRCVINKPNLSTETIVERAVSFVLRLRELIATHRIDYEDIYSLDETALFFDHNKAKTVHSKGAVHVQVIFIANYR
jgi:hypothetical protein